MGALSADRETKRKEGELLELPVAGSTKIYKGSLVALNTSGYAVPGADTANFIFAGVAHEQADNSGSATNGAKTVRVLGKGIFSFAASGMAITNVGTAVFIVDDQTVGLAATTTNDIPCGKIADFESATEVWVDIDQR